MIIAILKFDSTHFGIDNRQYLFISFCTKMKYTIIASPLKRKLKTYLEIQTSIHL